jgi:chemosensory pili system protein ChpA (sensor histidine kinase/response regulator)
LRISLVQDANDVLLTLVDDDAGLNLKSIRDKAVESGLLQAHQELGEDDLAKYLFMPGFSTFDGLSQLAGRGIGLDVVLSEVQALGGRIEVATKTGQGTTFRLVLPLTTAVTQLVMVRIGDFTFGIPSNMVANVQRLPAAELRAAYAAGQFQGPDGQKAAFFWMGALLHLSAPPEIMDEEHHAVLHLRSAGQYLACHVQEVLRNREVVVKNLGRQLARLPGLAGMTLLPSGATVLIYNPIALAAVYGSSARAIERGLPGQVDMSGVLLRPLAAPVPSGPQAPLIVVVDDAIAVRRVIQRTLLRAGYRVALANDGEQALQLLQEERPLLVISDIEMPRMDGFTLARNIREHPEYFDLPMVMISSRTAQKHRDHVQSLGVQHYFGKPYSEKELMALIRSYHAPAAV